MVRLARNMTRKSMALLTSLLLVLFWVPGLLAPSAHAAVNTTVPGSPYNGSNGVIPDSNASIQTTTDPVGNLDTTSFTGGKEDDQCPGVTTQGLASPKDDLTKVYFGSQNGTTAATSSDVFLYLAWERSTTSGTTTIDFELNQSTGAMALCNGVNPDRLTGDLLFTYDFSNGGGSVDIHYYLWDQTLNKGAGAWVAKGDITGLVDADLNPVVAAATDAAGIKGEMAVNLTKLPGVFTADTCKDFGAAWAKTRSSTSFESEIKDFVTPKPTIISNCAPLEILKEDSGTTVLAGATFSITANSGTHAVPAGQSPCTTQDDGFCRVEIPNTDPQAYAFPLLFPGSYHVVETAAPPGYLLPAGAATGTDVTVPQAKTAAGAIIPLTVHDPLGSIAFEKVDAADATQHVGFATFHIVRTADATGLTYDHTVTDNKAAADLLRRTRGVDDKHHLTLLCRDLSELANYARVDNKQYRLLKAATPGPYTFLLEATKEVPRRVSHPQRKTIGLRVPDHKVLLELLSLHGAPLLATTLIAPGETDALNDAQTIRERFEKQIAAVIDAGACPSQPTTVVDLAPMGTGDDPVVVRQGRGALAVLGL